MLPCSGDNQPPTVGGQVPIVGSPPTVGNQPPTVGNHPSEVAINTNVSQCFKAVLVCQLPSRVAAFQPASAL
jgi:hypothetical protein